MVSVGEGKCPTGSTFDAVRNGTLNGQSYKACVNEKGEFVAYPECPAGSSTSPGKTSCEKMELAPTGATGPSGTSTATTSTAAAGTATDTTAGVTPDVLTSDVYGIFVGVFVLVLSVFVLFSTGSIMSVLVLWATVALMVAVLVYYGFLDISKILPKKDTPPPAAATPPSAGSPLVGSEVFYVEQNQFTYDEAPAVCAAYDSELATLEQVIDAYNHGAEWCGYGWSTGGMALYPTQKSTWETLQREVDPGKRTRCGRPGVNGGYMDPMLKLGVNCYGFKPKGVDFKPPLPVPGTDKTKFDEMVARFREMLNTMKLSPFSRREWSGYDSTPGGAVKSVVEKFWGGEGGVIQMPEYTQTFATPYGYVEGFENADSSVVEAPTKDSYAVGPYGLRGDTGPTGPRGLTGAASTVPGPPGQRGEQGPQGLQGTQGTPGRDSTVAGPTGQPGATGATGPTGKSGKDGAAAAAGATGPVGPTGKAGTNGAKGDKGDKGDRGDKGDKGDKGNPTPIPSELAVSSLKVGNVTLTGSNNGLYMESSTAPGTPIWLWMGKNSAGQNHSSIMTKRWNKTDNWFGY